MKVKRSLLILCLATGLSLGGLYGCHGGQQRSDKGTSTAPASGETASNGNAGANDADTTKIQENLEAVKTAHKDLKTFIDSIVVTDNGTKVNDAVDYTQAKQKVDNLATAYDNFKNSLSEEIKTEIDFNTISPPIDDVLKLDSLAITILSNLAIGYSEDIQKEGAQKIEEYGDAQTELSQIKIQVKSDDEVKEVNIYPETRQDNNGNPVSNIDGKDGSRQKIAVKKLLLYKIYQPIEPLTKVTIPVKSPEGENGDEGNSGGENGGNTGGKSNSNTSTDNNAWIWPLINTFALLGAAGTGAFVIYKINQLNTTNTEDDAFVIKLEPEEDQQTNEQVRAKQELDDNLKKIQELLQDIKYSFIDEPISEVNDQFNQEKSFRFSLPFGRQENNNTVIGLNNKQYNELIKLINKLGVLLDDTYIAMLRYNNHGRYEQAIKTTIETIQQSIDEHINGLKNTPINQDELKQAINSCLSTIHPKMDNILQKVQSLPPNNLQNVAPTVDNTLTAQERQQFNERIQELTGERDNYKRELHEKEHQITQLRTGETEQIRQKYEKLFDEHKKLKEDYEKSQTLEMKQKRIEKERDDINAELNEVRQQLQEKIQQKDQQIQQKDQQIQQKDQKIERLEAIIGKKPPTKLSSPWQALVDAYQGNPENIKNNAIDEVMEDEDKLQGRRKNYSKNVIFSSNKSAEGYYIISSGNDYLLFPKQHGIPPSQKYTATAVFEGYKQGSTSKFTSIVPAQVTSLGNGMWQLKNKGRLEYS